MNKLDSHFNDFGGIDSRTNQMMQSPKTARDGRNFEYRTDGALNDFDVLAKRRGFQHKAGSGADVGLAQYIYRDLSTGEQKIEVLGVSPTGTLNKRIEETLTIAKAGGVVTSYSVFYDESVSNWRISFYDSVQAQVATYTFNNSVTLSSLATALNGLSITGLTFTSSSTLPAYYLDVVSFKELPTGSTVETVYSWQQVVTPNSSGVLFDYVASGAYLTNPEWAGISYVNLNNSIYITDGGFPIKYDGYSAYRAGMPRTVTKENNFSGSLLNGFQLTTGQEVATIDSSRDLGWTTGDHSFLIGLAAKEPSGFIVKGKILPVNEGYGVQITAPTLGSRRYIEFAVKHIKNDSRFPVYACKIKTTTVCANNATTVIPVEDGHNVKVGQVLRIPIFLNFYRVQDSGFYAKVTSVSNVIGSSSVTVTLANCPSGITVQSGYVLNSCYVQSEFENTSYQGEVQGIPDIYGAYYKILATKADAANLFYEAMYLPVPHDATTEYTIRTWCVDSLFGAIFDDAEGEELPRACRYLSQWQGQMIQGGRPYNTSIAQQYYPTSYFAPTTTSIFGGSRTITNILEDEYTETHLCDSQSIYWSDPLNPEGFPQSGAFEESFETLFADQVTGMGESKDSFFVFKDRSMFILNGELATGDIRKEKYEVDIGCASHNSVVSVKGGLIWLDKTHGFCAVVANQLPRVIGVKIQDWQKTNLFKNESDKLVYPGARAVNDLFGDKYICYVPRASGDLTFVLDYAENRGCWYIWDGISAKGGFIYLNDAVWFSSSNNLWVQKRTSSKYDFSDHTSPIAFLFKSAWINFGTQSVDKKWIQVIIQSARRGFEVLVSQYYNYIDTKEGEIALAFNEGSTVSPKRTVALNKLKSLAFSLGMENSVINQDVSVNGWELQYSPEYDIGEAKR